MSELEIIDMHTHVQRNEKHGREIRDYFLGKQLVKPNAPNTGTLDEVREMMATTGIRAANMLMFTWSGRYYRHGQYLLPDEEPARSEADAQLRVRAARRASDNNSWAASVQAADPRFSFFAGVNPVVSGADGAVEEVQRQRALGALGVKIVPSDMEIDGDDRRLFPLYEYCAQEAFPVLTETGGHSPHSRPAGFAGALELFPDLRLIFAHCGHGSVLGEGLDAEVLDLAARFDGVFGDTSLRLHEVADGVVEPEEMVRFLRTIGIDRLMFGTNYVFCDALPTRVTHKPAPEHIDPRFGQAWKAVEVLKTLPLSDDERALLASGTFKQLTGYKVPAVDVSETPA